MPGLVVAVLNIGFTLFCTHIKSGLCQYVTINTSITTVPMETDVISLHILHRRDHPNIKGGPTSKRRKQQCRIRLKSHKWKHNYST